MENINRKDYDLSYKISINIDTVQKCISDLENLKIGNRQVYYSRCVLERFDKCNENYVREFDNTLNKIHDELCNRDNFDHEAFKRFIKSSARLTSSIYDNYIKILYSLQK